MSVQYEVSAKTGTYTDREGNEKNRYVRMGVVMDTKNGGLMLKVEAIPVGWDGFAYLNSPREKGDGGANTPTQAAGQGQQSPGLDDDIPF